MWKESRQEMMIRLNESEDEHMNVSDPMFLCKECDEIKHPFNVLVKIDGKHKQFKVCPECGEELEGI
jgi:transcription initiation factor IIE alpha subunit